MTIQPRDAIAVQVPGGVLLTRRGSTLVLLAVEAAQRTAAARDGGAGRPVPDLVTLTSVLRQAIAQASVPHVTADRVTPATAAAWGQGAGRAPMSASEAGAALGITAHGARAACRRGTLAAARSPITGRWLITAGAMQEYDARRRRDGKEQPRLDHPGGA